MSQVLGFEGVEEAAVPEAGVGEGTVALVAVIFLALVSFSALSLANSFWKREEFGLPISLGTKRMAEAMVFEVHPLPVMEGVCGVMVEEVECCTLVGWV